MQKLLVAVLGLLIHAAGVSVPLSAVASEFAPDVEARIRVVAEASLTNKLRDRTGGDIKVLGTAPAVSINVPDDLKGAIRFIGVTRLPSIDAGTELADAQFLRYEDDTLFQVVVDLRTMTAGDIYAIRGANPRLADEEVREAERIVRASPEGMQLLRALPPEATLDFVVTGIGGATHSLAGHRLLRVLFNIQRQYFSTPPLYVDLSTRTMVRDISR
jgi:hypothetical protein